MVRINSDYEPIVLEKADFISWDDLKNQTILVTGATGLIGKTLIKTLDAINKTKKLNIHVIAFVRDLNRAKERFNDILSNDMVSLFEGRVEEPFVINDDIDYIIHGASKTASKDFIATPVETIQTSVYGTMNMLELARKKQVKKIVYLSSMEVYGYQKKGHKVSENEIGCFSTTDLRNSYPISKITSESLCYAYAKEYGVPTVVCRLAQTIGSEYSENDNRVFAFFDRSVKDKKNIVLKTKGDSERCYIFSLDAVMAILLLMTRGKDSTVYNVADETTYSSISSMAESVALSGGVKVEYNIQNEGINGFPPTSYLNLDTTLLKELGWKAIYNT